MKLLEFICFVLLLILFGFSDEESHREKYIDKYAPIAKYFEIQCGVPSSIQLAQAIYESGGGVSTVAFHSNNHFGIKNGDYWKGETYTTDHGTIYRAYKTTFESYSDHALFLHDNYILAVGKDWKHWVKYCKGYGGHPNYWGELGKIIEKYKLYKLDESTSNN